MVTRDIAPASRRSVHVVTTPDLRRVPAVEATIRGLRDSAVELSRSTYPGQVCP